MKDSIARSEKILIVDDSRTIRIILRDLLKSEGYRIAEAEDGATAFQEANEGDPDLILLDIVLPDESGYEICRRLRADSRFDNTPILFLSGLTEAEDKIKGLDLGGADYITKPFHRAEILARVRTHLRIRRLNREILETNQVLADTNDKLLEKQTRLDEDLEAAALVQSLLLPNALPRFDNLDLAYTFIPSEYIGGDVLDVFSLGQDHLGMYLLDVSGHGVASALVTFAAAQALRQSAALSAKQGADCGPDIVAPDEILTGLDRDFPQERFNKFITITYLILDVRTGRLEYSSAGHPPPLLIRAGGEVEFLEEGGPIIGLGGLVPFEVGRADMRPGDRLYVYTDGILEQTDPQGEMFGPDRLVKTLLDKSDQPVQLAVNAVFLALTGHGDRDRFDDDSSLIGLEYNASIPA